MKVMCFGTFDHLHPGHIDYFRQARRFGREFIIVVARDKNVFKVKGRWPEKPEAARARNIRTALKRLNWPVKVVLGGLNNQWLVLNKYRPDVICLGYDQKVDLKRLKSEIAGFRLFCRIKRLRAYRPGEYKSSYFRAAKTRNK